MLRIRILGNENKMITNEIKEYYQMPKSVFVYQFLPQKYPYIFVEESEEADICIIGCQHTDNEQLRENEINIFFSVENFAAGRSQYQHFNNFGDIGNEKIDIYIYNHVSHPIFRRDIPEIPKIMPTVYFRIQYFKEIEKDFAKWMTVPFEEKKFCLFTSQNPLNPNKLWIVEQMKKYGKVDFITEFPALRNHTCYHSLELLKLFNQYKFIICFENSHTRGYITEKIFNVFLSKSIPIYDGAPNIGEYITKGSFIRCDEFTTRHIELMMNTKLLYEIAIDTRKIDERYDNKLTNSYLDYYLKQKKKIN